MRLAIVVLFISSFSTVGLAEDAKEKCEKKIRAFNAATICASEAASTKGFDCSAPDAIEKLKPFASSCADKTRAALGNPTVKPPTASAGTTQPATDGSTKVEKATHLAHREKVNALLAKHKVARAAQRNKQKDERDTLRKKQREESKALPRSASKDAVRSLSDRHISESRDLRDKQKNESRQLSDAHAAELKNL